MCGDLRFHDSDLSQKSGRVGPETCVGRAKLCVEQRLSGVDSAVEECAGLLFCWSGLPPSQNLDCSPCRIHVYLITSGGAALIIRVGCSADAQMGGGSLT